jgi:hypothetical protein
LGKKGEFATPIPVHERQTENEEKKHPRLNLQPSFGTCMAVTVAVGATIVILIDPVPGDEVLIPVVWKLVLSY